MEPTEADSAVVARTMRLILSKSEAYRHDIPSIAPLIALEASRRFDPRKNGQWFPYLTQAARWAAYKLKRKKAPDTVNVGGTNQLDWIAARTVQVRSHRRGW